MGSLLRHSSAAQGFFPLDTGARDHGDGSKALEADDLTLPSELECGDAHLYIESSEKGTKLQLDEEKEEPTVLSKLEQEFVAPPLHFTKRMKAALKRKQRMIHDTAGPKWYDLPATPITPELKQELRMLQMRSVLDPARFYKANDSKTLPKYFQVGTYVDGAAEFYTDGATKKASKEGNMVEQILADVERRKYFKKKFQAIQQSRARAPRRKPFKKSKK